MTSIQYMIMGYSVGLGLILIYALSLYLEHRSISKRERQRSR